MVDWDSNRADKEETLPILRREQGRGKPLEEDRAEQEEKDQPREDSLQAHLDFRWFCPLILELSNESYKENINMNSYREWKGEPKDNSPLSVNKIRSINEDKIKLEMCLLRERVVQGEKERAELKAEISDLVFGGL